MVDLLVLPRKIPYDASKWLKVQALLDPEELKSLLEGVSGWLFKSEGEAKGVVECYRLYTEELKKGQIPSQPHFAWMWTLTLEALYLFQNQVKPRSPVVQITHHQMDYTPEDNTFRSNLYGPDTIFWGLQFSFPQLFQHPETAEVFKVQDSKLFPNVELFKYVQKWMRAHTIPTPFETVNAPQRIGKIALSWAYLHPQLKKKGLCLKLPLQNP